MRGISTALLERGDFASGTSSRSSKLIHGGIRYLEQGEVGLVLEAAAERRTLRKIAPHLAKGSFAVPREEPPATMWFINCGKNHPSASGSGRGNCQ